MLYLHHIDVYPGLVFFKEGKCKKMFKHIEVIRNSHVDKNFF